MAAVTLAACGELVEVPPASKGRILGSKGYEGSYISPSKFRLPFCMREPCPQLVLISAKDNMITEEMDVFLPLSNLSLDDVQVNLVVSVSTEPKDLDRILDRVPAKVAEGWDEKWIYFTDVYRTYVRERVRATVRGAVASKELKWLISNRELYSAEVHEEVNRVLRESSSPIVVKQFSFAKLNPPKVIKEAFQKAEERKIAVQQAEANKAVSIKEAEAALEVAKKTAAVRLEEARADLAVADLMAKVATPQWLAFRRLQVIEKMSDNKNVVFFPIEMGVDTAVSVQQLRRLDQLTQQAPARK